MSTIKMPAYQYDDCTVERWVDGDTLVMTARQKFDMGFHVTVQGEYAGMFRLLHVNAWERHDIPRGPEATAFVNQMMPVGTAVCAATEKDPDKYGRYLAELWLPGHPETTISAEIIAAGHGVPYMMDN